MVIIFEALGFVNFEGKLHFSMQVGEKKKRQPFVD